MTVVGWLPVGVGELFGPDATAEESYEVLTVDVPPVDWITALETARDRLGCTYFDWLSAVDEPGTGFRVAAHVAALSPLRRLLLRTTVPHEAPVLPTAVGVYAGAAWHERETHEMFGVVFEGHPALDHLLLPETFEGNPLRKDFVLAARVAKAWPGAKEPGESTPGGGPRRRQMLPPGVPDPNEWGPMKGRLPAAPTRGAGRTTGRTAGRTEGRTGTPGEDRAAGRVEATGGDGAPGRAGAAGERPARAAGERPVRRTRTAAGGSASQTEEASASASASASARGPEAPATPNSEVSGPPASPSGEASVTPAAPAAPPSPSSEALAAPASPSGEASAAPVSPAPRRARSASEGSASQRPGAAGRTGTPRRSRSASGGSASQRANPETQDEAPKAPAPVPPTSPAPPTPPAPPAAPRSLDAPWHHARPAFDDQETPPAPDGADGADEPSTPPGPDDPTTSPAPDDTSASDHQDTPPGGPR
ncbi:NADH-quinone oxidoreductase subunit C [Streptomyces sp. CRN 30]|uniref:NADH-quinone oxidoreductase subunit C n=1 Tax=Streptomyces sp. CRN 30 TaxID=3075613 RepID=UPI002A83528F|nr:NADH-quinone oxidoreductase subunit C [Streptomyces sp. CRN 30]